MGQYLLSVWHDRDYSDIDWSDPAVERTIAQVTAFNDDLSAAGAMAFAGGLQPATVATVFRHSEDHVDKADGPYLGTGQQVGGFWVIEVADDAEAASWAERAAAACGQPVELRPFQTE